MSDTNPDIRLIAVDMDGTFLDADHKLPHNFDAFLDALGERGITFCPASGRQYYSLFEQMGERADGLDFIAENGAYVLQGTEEVSSTLMDDALVRRVVTRLREHAAGGGDIGVVVCGKKSAYVERADEAFLAETSRYYRSLATIDDLLDWPEDGILKIAVFDFDGSEHGAAPVLTEFSDEGRVAVSGKHWVDLMGLTTNKGGALRALQDALGVTASQTMAFGDYLNDLELLDAAEWSYAMANAHPQVKERARFEAPSNTENGVVVTVSRTLGLGLH
ncbi:Cof-type HAD-IIB family hydrolase [Demequina aurantiaca]|uniref:Cof-type HAD-IIB family hydrolase n=1 Tax=Demequina aurantiaca TaxID=676200 RepID=UPI000ABC69AE|nr:Cof-type HAD-IIB family hydrolase [Demequina aurantiaca]